MRSLIVPLLIFVCLFLGFVFLLTNTPLFVNIMLPKLINDNMEDIQIESFHCRQQKSRLPEILILKKVAMKVRKDSRVFDITASEVTIHNFLDFVREHNLLRLSARGLTVQTDHVSARGGQLKTVIKFKDWKVVSAEGAAFSQEFAAGVYQFQKITGHFKATPKKAKIFDVDSKFYGGEVKGQVNIDYDPRFAYVVWAEFSGIQSQAVEAPYPGFFADIHGELSGSARVVGEEYVDIFTIVLKGGKDTGLSPGLFLRMKGAFDDEEFSKLEKLNQDGALLIARESTLHIQNSRRQNVMLVFDIVESQDGLVLKGRFPFRWDGDFQSFLFPVEDAKE